MKRTQVLWSLCNVCKNSQNHLAQQQVVRKSIDQDANVEICVQTNFAEKKFINTTTINTSQTLLAATAANASQFGVHMQYMSALVQSI